MMRTLRRGALFAATLVVALSSPLQADDGLDAALEGIHDPAARARVTEHLRSDDPDLVRRGMAALLGWIRWNRYTLPPEVGVAHAVGHKDMTTIVRFALRRAASGEPASEEADLTTAVV
jgi:hypothetical protein